MYLPSVLWCPLVGAERDSCGRNGGGRVSFSDKTGYMSKLRVQFCGKVASAGCTQHIFRLGRVKTCVDQSAQLISRWMKMGTLLYRQMTRVHLVVSFTLIFFYTEDLRLSQLEPIASNRRNAIPRQVTGHGRDSGIWPV